jgi:DNA-binding response OmpR family regulator
MSDRKSKILIVEDEEALATVLNAKLEKEGYDMAVTFDGEAGYSKIKEWSPDLILLDIVMPKMDGYEVLEKMNLEGIKIPVIIISNSGQPVEIEKTKKLGAVDHLIKTQFDPKEVVTKVKNYLETDDGKIISAPQPSAKPVEGGDGKLGIKVLLVEDDTFLREICSKKLVKEGFTVFEAVDGEQVIREIDQIQPDIVLLDIILPALDGFGVLTSIRQNPDEKVKTVPVIMLSNLGQEDDIKKAMEIGANNYLVKAHFTTDEIVDKIKTLLNK